MITGSGLKNRIFFDFASFSRFFDAMILMFLIRFLFVFLMITGRVHFLVATFSPF